MKKIGLLIYSICICISVAGCRDKTTPQGSESKTVVKNNVIENSGATKLKELKLLNNSMPSTLSETRIECELPEVPESVEVFEASSTREADGAITYRPTPDTGNPYSTEEPLLTEKAAEVAKGFLSEKGVKVSNEDLNVMISSSITSYDGKVDAQTISIYVHRDINGLRLYDGDIVVRVAKGYKIVGYKKTEFDLVSKGYYKIISPKEAVDSIPKFMDVLDGPVLSSIGTITDVDLCYFSLVQNNIQPVYVIQGYTDKNKKDDKFRIIIPAVK